MMKVSCEVTGEGDVRRDMAESTEMGDDGSNKEVSGIWRGGRTGIWDKSIVWILAVMLRLWKVSS